MTTLFLSQKLASRYGHVNLQGIFVLLTYYDYLTVNKKNILILLYCNLLRNKSVFKYEHVHILFNSHKIIIITILMIISFIFL